MARIGPTELVILCIIGLFIIGVIVVIVIAIVAGKKTVSKVPPPSSQVQKPIYSKIVGVTKNNPGDVSRQDLIRQYAKPGLPLIPIREPDNQFDPNAIALYITTPTGQVQLGYLSSDLAADFAPALDQGQAFRILINNITGGLDDEESLGVNIEINRL